MAEPDATQVIAGPGKLYIAPLGTALPTVGVWGGWREVGYTDAGIDMVYTPTVKPEYVDEETAPVLDILEKEAMHLAAHLAEVTLQNMFDAIAASTFAGSTITVGSLPLQYVMVGAEGPAPPQFGTVRRMIVVQKALTVAAISMKFTRKNKMVFPVSWEARKLSLLPLFTITDV